MSNTNDPAHDRHAPNPVVARAAGNNTPAWDRVLEREKAQFGGMKFGSAFFGWLTATGTAVLLTALLAAIGTVIGFSTNLDPGQVTNDAADNAGTIGVVAAIVFAAIVLVAYYCGGYVAGRMARFDGLKQGVAVWLWTIIIAIVLTIVGFIAGNQADVLSGLTSVPRIPLNGNDVTAASITTTIIALAISLLGAILGGLAGMRYHRRVDSAGVAR
ncbi:hypothetical protein [Cryobacterium sp. PH31-L1]|uniref:hypothetical protein n=1 Tax=Cryobacterium sp. PH31-L1 TaxID=3046199 RepID=UPI0024B8A48D|nr:hypothetical protein [Cryobacterium sp. PH31-L1]MDJ0379062.1 hypothetical protein [Cryobacterium sp. PH31-L1]